MFSNCCEFSVLLFLSRTQGGHKNLYWCEKRKNIKPLYVSFRGNKKISFIEYNSLNKQCHSL